jgi:uncharacterized protein (TIGR03083 family)
MPLSPLAPTDTRPLFRPVSSALVDLLRSLPLGDWDRPTVAGTWAVRDLVAHLVDLSLRRLSFDRDRMAPPPPPFAIQSERDFVRFINGVNAEWVTAAKRLSPRVLTDLLQKATTDLADWFESRPLDVPGLFGVSWAGEHASEGLFDIGREFTELWHHQEQIRMAVGAPSLDDVKFLRPVLEIAVRGLPHAFRDAAAPPGTTVMFEVSGPARGRWTLVRETERWTIHEGEPDATPATRVRLTQDAAWKLLFNALDDDAAMAVEGNEDLARPLLTARSIVI